MERESKVVICSSELLLSDVRFLRIPVGAEEGVFMFVWNATGVSSVDTRRDERVDS